MAKTASLQDSFLDSGTKATLWSNSSSAVTIGSGVVTIPCDATYESLASTGTYDLVGSTLASGVNPPPTGAGDRQFAIYLQQSLADSNNQIGMMWQDNSSITPMLTQAGTGVTITPSFWTYDAVAQLYWRMRESGGTIFFDTAPDGKTWTNQASVAYTMTVTSLFVLAQSGFFSTDTTSNGTLFNLNPGTIAVQGLPGTPLRQQAPMRAAYR